jgi:surface polysaccharide O-acyltransferase-like enzyme
MQEKRTNPKERLFGLDLLKLLSMLMIIFHHLSKHGGFWAASTGATRWGIAVINGLFAPSVNLFVFVSAYLMIKRGRVTVRGYLRLYAEVVFYTLLTYAAACLLGAQSLSAIMLLKCFLPISYPVFWFAKMYFLMYLAAPLLLVLVKHLEQKPYQITVGAIFLILSLQTFLRLDILPLANGFSALWFMLLFLLAGYWVRFGVSLRKRYWALIWAVSTAYMCLWVWQNGLDIGYTHVFVALQTVSAFGLLQDLRCERGWLQKSAIWLSSCTFGIYLLHDGDFVRTLLYERILRTPAYYTRVSAIGWLLLFALIILAAGLLVESLRKLAVQMAGKLRKKDA